MKLNEQIFREYDIRGIYPDELNEDGLCEVCAAVKLTLSSVFGGAESFIPETAASKSSANSAAVISLSPSVL